MAWTYHDYEEQTTGALRLSRLRQHITEVNQEIQKNMASGERRVEHDTLVNYLKQLQQRREELESKSDSVSSDDPRVTSSFTRVRCTKP